MVQIVEKKRKQNTGALRIRGSVPGSDVTMLQSGDRRGGFRKTFTPGIANDRSLDSTITTPISMGTPNVGFRADVSNANINTPQGMAAFDAKSRTLQPGESVVALPEGAKIREQLDPVAAAAKQKQYEADRGEFVQSFRNHKVNGKTTSQEAVEPILNADQAAEAKQRAAEGGFLRTATHDSPTNTMLSGAKRRGFREDQKQEYAQGLREQHNNTLRDVAAIDASGKVAAAEARAQGESGVESFTVKDGEDSQRVVSVDAQGNMIQPKLVNADGSPVAPLPYAGHPEIADIDRKIASFEERYKGGERNTGFLFNSNVGGLKRKIMKFQKMRDEKVAELQEAGVEDAAAGKEMRDPLATLPQQAQTHISAMQNKLGRELTAEEVQYIAAKYPAT